LDSDLTLLAAGDPVFGDFKPDDYKAYFRFRIATALPKVIGPEMNGNYFGIHPQVLANSYRSLLHQQTNLGHKLKAHGAHRDRIVGTVVGVAIGNMQRQTVQKMADTVEGAQYLDVIAVVHKQAEGVKELLGKHLTSKEKTSVSIETKAPLATMGIFDPRDRSILPLAAAVERFPEAFKVDKKNRDLRLGGVDGVRFAWAPGGESGSIPFQGVGYTPTPAEGDTARILDLAASECGEHLAFAAIAMNDWEPGADVYWTRVLSGDAGSGRVVDVITSGTITRHGLTKRATPADPLLAIAVHGKPVTVIRASSSVVKRR
jgi:hypothetical protein